MISMNMLDKLTTGNGNIALGAVSLKGLNTGFGNVTVSEEDGRWVVCGREYGCTTHATIEEAHLSHDRWCETHLAPGKQDEAPDEVVMAAEQSLRSAGSNLVIGEGAEPERHYPLTATHRFLLKRDARRFIWEYVATHRDMLGGSVGPGNRREGIWWVVRIYGYNDILKNKDTKEI